MHRRAYLLGATASVVTLSGCGLFGSGGGGASSVGTEGDGTDGGGPRTVIRRWLLATSEPDLETANRLMHPDAPLGNLSRDDVDPSEEFEVLDTRVLKQNNTHAIVGATMRASDSGRTTLRYILRPAGGRWKVWGDAPEALQLPDVRLAFDYERDAGELTISHDGGQTILARNLALRGQHISTGSWLDLGGEASGELDGEPAVVTLDSLTVSAPPDYVARLVWRPSPDLGYGTLATDRGPEA